MKIYGIIFRSDSYYEILNLFFSTREKAQKKVEEMNSRVVDKTDVYIVKEYILDPM